MTTGRPPRPTPAELAAAEGRHLRDVIAHDLDVLFCGINPGLWTAAVGHHFAHPGNRFWKALHQSGFTPELLSPYDDERLTELGLGLTNLVDHASRSAAELSRAALEDGARQLARTVRRYRPRAVAILGMDAYRKAFGQRTASIGEQPGGLEGARLWLLPNPSGLQGRYQLDAVVAELVGLRQAVRASSV